MVDPISLAAISVIFAPIITDIVKDSAKDFCKGSLQNVFAGHGDWKRATAKALTEFVLQFQEELVGAGEEEDSFANYEADLKGFVGQAKPANCWMSAKPPNRGRFRRAISPPRLATYRIRPRTAELI